MWPNDSGAQQVASSVQRHAPIDLQLRYVDPCCQHCLGRSGAHARRGHARLRVARSTHLRPHTFAQAWHHAHISVHDVCDHQDTSSAATCCRAARTHARTLQATSSAYQVGPRSNPRRISVMLGLRPLLSASRSIAVCYCPRKTARHQAASDMQTCLTQPRARFRMRPWPPESTLSGVPERLVRLPVALRA